MGLTVAARLVWIQTAQSSDLALKAQAIQTDLVDLPAARGDIVDRNGNLLAGNRTTFQVSADETVSQAALQRLSQMSSVPVADLQARLLVCGQPGAQPGTCYRGQPGEPIPVLSDVSIPIALSIDDAGLPGISVSRAAVRDYPSKANAAHLLGYLREGAGQSGLEAQYDLMLQGEPGQAVRELNREGQPQRRTTKQPVAGQTLVTSLDIETQKVAERALRKAVTGARREGYKATGGSVVVMDARNGQIRAMASYPTYDPNIWAKGLSEAEYADLTDKKSGQPLVFRPAQSVAPPASTFKAFTTVAASEAGFDLNGTYDCPALLTVGGQTFTNYETRAYGPMSLARALSVSCDTVFYRLGYKMWKRDGGLEATQPEEHVVRTARDFGLGSTTGVDLPGESAGSVPDREQVRSEFEQSRDDYCARARTGYPEESNRARARLLKAYARDYCRSGDQYRAGDALNTAIGQGRSLVTPLQLATAYAAIANGGTRVTPHLATGFENGTTIDPAPRGTVSARPATLAYVRRALATTTVTGTASGAFLGFPLDQYPIAAKTGTAEVAGKQSTSWFASFAPADDPEYVVVVNVDQGGLGAATSGPVARAVYEQMFGIAAP
ncbi:MAG: penicillin-binding protein [Actinobacteria bacterium]|nr:penicillin-binding protein [Actinomycetota bacterium]HPE11026.1 penicillin-binding transpeptidase domain-containing protein [Actinomycetota bacterium]HPQ84938.1 penicillin-binding transpeptidase domain-containing protein [Actinomycetota bacterium]